MKAYLIKLILKITFFIKLINTDKFDIFTPSKGLNTNGSYKKLK